MAEKRTPVDVVWSGSAGPRQSLPGTDRRGPGSPGAGTWRVARHGDRLPDDPCTGTNCATTGATTCFWRRRAETQTFRNNRNQIALPIRRWGSYLPGVGVGGAGVHWNGQTFRFLPSDFVAKSHNEERYGPLPDEMTVQDYGVTYDELEPHFDKFEKLCGISGKAGNLQGRIVEGGQPLRGLAQRRISQPADGNDLRAASLRGGRGRGSVFNPFPAPSANMSRGLHQSAGRSACALHLLRILREIRLRQLLQGSPQTTIIPVLMQKPNFTLRTHCEVLQVLKDQGRRAGKRALPTSTPTASSGSSRRRSSFCADTSSRTPA